MNEIADNFLLAGGKFMPQIHLIQPRFRYNTGGTFTKNKSRIQNLKKQQIHNMFIKMNQIKLVSNMIYGDFQNLTERTSQAEILREHVSMVYNIFEKKKLVLVVLKTRISYAIL